jgi:RNA polymerase sigma-70 factor, ECF subfamily
MSLESTPSPVQGEKSDLELMEAVARKDEAALAELFKRFQGRVVNLCFRYMGKRDEAELMTEDVFLRIWNFANSFRGTSQVWTWIYRIAVNLCLTEKARKHPQIQELKDDVPDHPHHEPEAAHERNEQQEIIQQALDSLPPDQRMAIMLSQYEAMSYVEIAEIMGKSKSAVATLLFRAREQMRLRLEPFVRRGKLSP